ncbi:hypothetical protein KUTeg_010970 [Tegillarca granosa]|uniref:Glutathione peroxidase n=1 Tax=Tegillarca granosa TaxID=220873 RepID=A0ABQ9F2I8_TEGGR|nr:hypothetical protein KUTeg_010970 [Tegillarca granosa]
MNALHQELSSQGFSVVGVPCNQFNKEEPGWNGTEIMDGLKHVRPGGGFVPSFPMTEKVDVNGERQHPLYVYLKKFLVGRDGRVAARYHPKVLPEDIRDDILLEIKKPNPFPRASGIPVPVPGVVG